MQDERDAFDVRSSVKLCNARGEFRIDLAHRCLRFCSTVLEQNVGEVQRELERIRCWDIRNCERTYFGNQQLVELRIERVQRWLGGRLEEVQRSATRQGETMVGALLIFDVLIPLFQDGVHVMQGGNAIHILILANVHIRTDQ